MPVGLQLAKRCDTRGHRQRIAAQRSCLVHRTNRGDHVHELRRTAISADRQAATDDLAQRGEVGLDVIQLGSASEGDTKSGHHFIEDEQRAFARSDQTQSREISGRGKYAAHVAHHRLNDDACELALELVEGGHNGGDVVVRQC